MITSAGRRQPRIGSAVLLALLCLFPFPAAAAQSASAPMAHEQAVPGIAAISAQQCVWHAGDNPAWAAPNLDEAGWQPFTQWKLNPGEPRIWVRCHADLTSPPRSTHSAIQVTLAAAYQLYVNGRLVGSAGNLRNGMFSLDTVRTYPVTQAVLGSHPALFALRIAWRYMGPPQVVRHLPFGIVAGSRIALTWRRDSIAQEALHGPLTDLILFSAVGVIGLVLLALYFHDRTRTEVLILSLACVSVGLLFALFFCISALVPMPVSVCVAAFALVTTAASLGQIWFPFAAARRRMPLLFWILFCLQVWPAMLHLFSVFLSPESSLQVGKFLAVRLGVLIQDWALIISRGAPFVAFWPYTRISRRMLPIALTCMAWGATMMVYFLAYIPGMNDIQAVVTLCATAALLALLFRDQQRTARERAELAGEMQAASAIQRMLAPVAVATIPGLRAEVAFYPMRDVGGDFYLSRALSDGRQRVLVGDVSGKGSAAAMTAALLLGAAAARDSDSPSALLAHLNRVLRENRLEGFATCLCADIGPDGSLTAANAGHLSPYLSGQEMELPSGLPLGIAGDTDAQYREFRRRLAFGQTLTFLSDGVVEARDAAGELFGFDRTRGISTQSAEEIARAAQAFGQQDDITVLTLQFAPAEVAHA